MVLKTSWPSPLGENQVKEVLSSNKQTIRRYIPEKWASKVDLWLLRAYTQTHTMAPPPCEPKRRPGASREETEHMGGYLM